ncbi:hypothetical protein [Paenibacillus hunanensis]|uniref:Cell division protein YceG involved in septum cleavage n=1 Tax=Paenibacillus hunanensis TaxID=539262 RepID=A0ABU1ITW7_9BACL|nr:hypothetical protein [Paenibacillus hunanensis]MCL9661786.1 hypothetical protein [Paenibacillus hunanensis]MDR6242700.1 cell division protein YceG involved in septum cleavage [Paenibacillus hunanensis]GGJ02075.1 hypothetical protein GCM10008022_08760 [Paenibacillus hunanensis]
MKRTTINHHARKGKRMISTLLLGIAISSLLLGEQANAQAAVKTSTGSSVVRQQQDPFLSTVGADSDEDVYDDLYEGGSLADTARRNNKNPQAVIDLQVAQMNELLTQRLINGSITPDTYRAQKEELTELITKSVYGQHPYNL